MCVRGGGVGGGGQNQNLTTLSSFISVLLGGGSKTHKFNPTYLAENRNVKLMLAKVRHFQSPPLSPSKRALPFRTIFQSPPLSPTKSTLPFRTIFQSPLK